MNVNLNNFKNGTITYDKINTTLKEIFANCGNENGEMIENYLATFKHIKINRDDLTSCK